MKRIARNIYRHGLKYQATVTFQGHTVYLGAFTDLDDAIIARDSFKDATREEKEQIAMITLSKKIVKSKLRVKKSVELSYYEQAQAKMRLLSGHKYAVRVK